MAFQLEFDPRKRGDTFPFEVALVKADGSEFNATGYTLKFVVTTTPNPTDDSTKIIEIEGTPVDIVNGIIEFQPSAADVDRVGDYYHEIEMSSGTWVKTIAEGPWAMTQDRVKNP